MNNSIYLNQSYSFMPYVSNMNNLSENINVFSELKNIDQGVSIATKTSYNSLITTIKEILNRIDMVKPIDHNLSKMSNYIDEDKDIQIEWIVRNNFRIGFIIDSNGDIYYWRMYKNGNATNTISDNIPKEQLNERITSIILEVLKLT